MVSRYAQIKGDVPTEIDLPMDAAGPAMWRGRGTYSPGQQGVVDAIRVREALQAARPTRPPILEAVSEVFRAFGWAHPPSCNPETASGWVSSVRGRRQNGLDYERAGAVICTSFAFLCDQQQQDFALAAQTTLQHVGLFSADHFASGLVRAENVNGFRAVLVHGDLVDGKGDRMPSRDFPAWLERCAAAQKEIPNLMARRGQLLSTAEGPGQ